MAALVFVSIGLYLIFLAAFIGLSRLWLDKRNIIAGWCIGTILFRRWVRDEEEAAKRAEAEAGS
jgi:hypothetical protein